MKVETLSIPGLLLVSDGTFVDHRGIFQESYVSEHFVKAGLPFHYAQENVSTSRFNAIRGLHVQRNRPQGKLIKCVYGKIMDVVLDLVTGRFETIELDSLDNQSLWIPPGYAHGFQTLSETSVVTYKCTTLYDRETDGGVNPFDPELAIPWKFMDSPLGPLVSDKDRKLPTLKDYKSEHWKF